MYINLSISKSPNFDTSVVGEKSLVLTHPRNASHKGAQRAQRDKKCQTGWKSGQKVTHRDGRDGVVVLRA